MVTTQEHYIRKNGNSTAISTIRLSPPQSAHMKRLPAKTMSCGDSAQQNWTSSRPSDSLSSDLTTPAGIPVSVGGGVGADALGVNALLHRQLQKARTERAAATAALEAARQQHAESAVRWEAERHDLIGGGGGSGADTAATRIMELSRRVRHLTAELETERTKRRRLESLPLPPPQPPASSRPASETSADTAQSQTEESAAQLRDKLRDTTRRLVEVRNQAQAARRELRQAERLLQQEVGETASVQSLLAAGTGWRGRAQQIVTLRAQLQEASASAAADTAAMPGFEAGHNSAGGVRSEPRLSAADSRARSHLKTLEQEQRAAARQAAEQARQQANENASLRLKIDASRARAAAVAKEASDLREQIGRLSEKSKNDDEMIEALLNQVRQLELELTAGCRAAAAAAAAGRDGTGGGKNGRPTASVLGEQMTLLRAQLAARDEQLALLEARLANQSDDIGDLSASPVPPPPPSEDVTTLQRKCVEAEFLLEAASSERRRLADGLRSLQTQLAERERQLQQSEEAMLLERQTAVCARRETSRLQLMLGRNRRTGIGNGNSMGSGGGGGCDPNEVALLRQELERLRQDQEQQRTVREEDLQRYEETMEEARQIFCQGLTEAAARPTE